MATATWPGRQLLVLDVCCGSRMFWFDKQDSRALFVDNRCEVQDIDIGTPGTIGRAPVVVVPDIVASFTALPFPDESFYLVVFDPPHIEQSRKTRGILTIKYGSLEDGWRQMLAEGFIECFRVLKENGVLVFKWAEVRYPVSEILKLTNAIPLFGHKSGKSNKTHWITFMKRTSPPQASLF